MIGVQRLSWTLLHFMWQGTVIVLAYAVLRSLLTGLLPVRGRYALACSALVAMAMAPPLTFLMISNVGGAVWTISAAPSQWLSVGIVAGWFVGASIFSVRLIGAWRFTARLRHTSYPATAAWQDTVEKIAAEMQASRAVQLLVSSLIEVPTVIGWLQPAILIPLEALTGMPHEHLTVLLAHEIAHIRRNDYLSSVLQSVAEALLFYHPAVWWISDQIRIERELCCDDMAVVATGDVLLYARALATLESRHPRQTPALSANGGSLLNRVRRLLGESNVPAEAPTVAAALAMALLCFVGAGSAVIHAAPTRPPVARLLNPQPIPLFTQARRSLLYDPFIPKPPLQRAQLTPAPLGQSSGSEVLGLQGSSWLNQDVVYIITDQERRAFLGLRRDGLRENFVEQFWLRRDPTPDTPENEFKDEHYRRIAYANAHFSSDAIGWKTDRGRVYITYGPPDEIDLHRVGPPLPTESWRYRVIPGVGAEVAMDFSDPKNSGEYRLAQSAAEELRAIATASSGNFLPRSMESQMRTNVAPPPTLGTAPPGKTLPMLVRVDYLRLTDSTTLSNITIQFDNHDLRVESRNGSEIMHVNLAGQIATLEGRSVATFEKPYAWNVRQEFLQQFSMQQIPMQPFSNRRSVLQQSFPLAPGRYRLRIVAKDALAETRSDFQSVLDVPSFSEDKLASSSLIVADTIERLPARVFGEGAVFAIGDTKVRPRVGNTFTSDEKMGIYLQLYNFLPDETSGRPTASVEYEISRVESNEKVMVFTEEVGRMPHSSAKQVTIEKMLPLGHFVPGTYILRIKVNDRSANTVSQQQETFNIGIE